VPTLPTNNFGIILTATPADGQDLKYHFFEKVTFQDLTPHALVILKEKVFGCT